MFSSISYAEYNWTRTGETNEGTFYLDFDNVRRVSNLVYFYELNDYIEPYKGVIFSVIIYQKIDCEKKMQKVIQIQNYKVAMGKGDMLLTPPEDLTRGWFTTEDQVFKKGQAKYLCENY